MSPSSKKISTFHERRLKFRDYVQSGGKSVAEALAFARKIGFPMPGHYITHAIFIGRWKVGTFMPSENDRDERKMEREKAHARIGDEIARRYSDCGIETIDPWKASM